MKALAAARYAEFDERRRAHEAERAAAEELDDLRALTAIEHGRARLDGRPPVPGENTTSDDGPEPGDRGE